MKTEHSNNPKIKIVAIDNSLAMDTAAIEEDINTRNFCNFNNAGKVIHMYTVKDKNLTTVFMEVTADIYKHIRENNNQILVGYQSCKAYDLINVKPCFNCAGFGHNGAKCRNTTICIKCSGNHKENECKNSNHKCPVTTAI